MIEQVGQGVRPPDYLLRCDAESDHRHGLAAAAQRQTVRPLTASTVRGQQDALRSARSIRSSSMTPSFTYTTVDLMARCGLQS